MPTSWDLRLIDSGLGDAQEVSKSGALDPGMWMPTAERDGAPESPLLDPKLAMGSPYLSIDLHTPSK